MADIDQINRSVIELTNSLRAQNEGRYIRTGPHDNASSNGVADPYHIELEDEITDPGDADNDNVDTRSAENLEEDDGATKEENRRGKIRKDKKRGGGNHGKLKEKPGEIDSGPSPTLQPSV